MTAVIDPPVEAVAVARRGRLGSWRPSWPFVMAFVAFVLYAVVGIWLMGQVNYAIGDALVRSANARVILFSRDPHLAALGMAWMPLPVLSQLPFEAILHPLGLAWWSGPVSTAAYGAGSVYVLGRMARHLDLRQRYAMVVVGLYAFNPVIVFWSASGMSESCTFFFLIAGSSLFISWIERPDPWTLGGASIMIGLATLSRYEMIAFAAAIALGGALVSARGRRLRTAVVVMLPSVFVMLVWLIANQILLRDAFAWWHNLKGNGAPPSDAPWLPGQRTPWTSVQFVLVRLLRLAPALVFLVPLALWAPSFASARRRWGVLAVTAGFSVTPVTTGYFLLTNSTWGNLRYFVPLVVVAVMIALWIGRAGHLTTPSAAITCVLLAAGLLAGSVAETQVRFAGVESEFIAVRRMMHLRPLALASQANSQSPDTRVLVFWKRVTKQVDASMSDKDLVIADTSTIFPVLLYTTHLERFLISEDRTFEQQLQLVRPAYNMILVGGPGPSAAALRAILATPSDRGVWDRVFADNGLELWRLDPLPAPNATNTPARPPAP